LYLFIFYIFIYLYILGSVDQDEGGYSLFFLIPDTQPLIDLTLSGALLGEPSETWRTNSKAYYIVM